MPNEMKIMIPAIVIVAIVLFAGGYKSHIAPKPSDSSYQSASPAAPDLRAQEVEWLHTITNLENSYTERTYQCMTEMYSLAYSPVDSGPICRESCKLLKQINTMTNPGPAYVHNPQQYYLGDSEVCKERKPRSPKVRRRAS